MCSETQMQSKSNDHAHFTYFTSRDFFLRWFDNLRCIWRAFVDTYDLSTLIKWDSGKVRHYSFNKSVCPYEHLYSAFSKLLWLLELSSLLLLWASLRCRSKGAPWPWRPWTWGGTLRTRSGWCSSLFWLEQCLTVKVKFLKHTIIFKDSLLFSKEV